MKNSLALAFLLQALAYPGLAAAAPATSYRCVGSNTIDAGHSEKVVFTALFSEWAPRKGYTSQSIEVTKKGRKSPRGSIVFQMVGASKANQCELSRDGEIFLSGKSFKMTTDEYNRIIMSFFVECGEGLNFDVNNAICVAE